MLVKKAGADGPQEAEVPLILLTPVLLGEGTWQSDALVALIDQVSVDYDVDADVWSAPRAPRERSTLPGSTRSGFNSMSREQIRSHVFCGGSRMAMRWLP